MAIRSPHLICSDVRVANLARAVRFYGLLGLRPTTRARMKDGTQIVWVGDPITGQLLELFHLSPRSPLFKPFRRRTETNNALIFSVPNMAELIARLRRSGAKVEVGFEQGEVRFAFLKDPDGTWIELLGWTEKARERHPDLPLMALSAKTRPKKRRSR